MRHPRCTVWIGVWLLVAGLPSARAGETPTDAPTVPAIRAADLERHVEALTSEAFAGRATTTEGERLASAYLAGELARFGCQGAGEDGGFFQPYAVPRPELGAKNHLVATIGEETVTYAVEKDFNPFSATASAAVAGPLVFAGYGITAPGRSWDDYADADVQGKVVLVLRKDPGWGDVRHAAFVAKWSNALRHGAAAVLLCNDAATAADAGDAPRSWSEPTGGAPDGRSIPFVFVTREVAGRLLSPLGADLAALEASWRTGGRRAEAVPGVAVDLETEITRTTELNARNVVARVEGRDPALRHETVIVGGHYDHLGVGNFGSLAGPGAIHPGADDNASGTAAVLEVAEYFARPEHRPRRSLLFVLFSGEEMGLLGSQHYVAHPVVPLEDTVAMINLDMVGRSQDGRLQVGGVGTGEGLEALVRAANEGEDLVLGTSPGGNAPSDSMSFFRKKIPVLFLFTGMHADYHRPSDTSDKIHYAELSRIAALARDVVDALAGRDERLVFTEPPEAPRPPRIGIQPGPDGDEPGVVAQAVTPSGPAAKAGVRAGDVIVAIAEQSVRNLDDLRAVLVGLEPGQKVGIVVLRGGERLALEIVPAGRPRR